MANDQMHRKDDRYEQKILLASEYVVGLVDVLKKMLAKKKAENQ